MLQSGIAYSKELKTLGGLGRNKRGTRRTDFGSKYFPHECDRPIHASA